MLSVQPKNIDAWRSVKKKIRAARLHTVTATKYAVNYVNLWDVCERKAQQ